MAMQRPYFSSSIEELESLFQIGKLDKALLQVLDVELQHRKTKRAIQLGFEIRECLAKNNSDSTVKPRPVAVRAQPVDVSRVPDPRQDQQQSQGNPITPSVVPKGPIPEISNEVQSILNSWIALEVLAPQGFRKEEDLSGGRKDRIVSLDQSEMPWERGEKSLPKKRLFYEIILGTIKIGPAVEQLLKVYADTRPDAKQLNQQSPIASLIIDKAGRPIEDNGLVISSFAWGVPVALSGDLKRLARWTKEETQLTERLKEPLLKKDSAGEIPVLTSEKISDLFSRLVSELGLHALEIKSPYFAVRRYEFFANKNPPEPSLLNSFFWKIWGRPSNLRSTRNYRMR